MRRAFLVSLDVDAFFDNDALMVIQSAFGREPYFKYNVVVIPAPEEFQPSNEPPMIEFDEIQFGEKEPMIGFTGSPFLGETVTVRKDEAGIIVDVDNQ
jgi:hypothetical protein